MTSLPAFAAANNLNLVKNNAEVKSAIASFEANRSQKCSEISDANTHFHKNGTVKVQISCNQYDANGEPQANVYLITIRGFIYSTYFELGSVSIVGAE